MGVFRKSTAGETVYQDGSVDIENKAILTADGVEYLDYPRLLRAFERIGDAVITMTHAALSQAVALRYPMQGRDCLPKPGAEASRTVGAVCTGTCIFLIASKSPEAAQVVAGTMAESAQDWIQDNITEPLARMGSGSSWLR